MRTVTFSDDELQNRLPENFVLAWDNTEGMKGSGDSYRTKPGQDLPYRPRMASGYNNSQVIVLTPEGRVLNVYPGYWSPDFFKKAIQASWLLYRNVWTSDRYTQKQKEKLLKAFYREEARLLYNYKIGVPADLRKHLIGPNDPAGARSLVSVQDVAGGGKSGTQKLRNHKKVAMMKKRLTKEKYFLTSWKNFDTVQFVGIPSGFAKFYGIDPKDEKKETGDTDFDQPNFRKEKPNDEEEEQDTFGN